MYRERTLLGFTNKSRGEKRLVRFSFIRAEAFIAHPFGCYKRYESRLQFLMRTHRATFTARCVMGDTRDFRALLEIAAFLSRVCADVCRKCVYIPIR